MFTIIKTTSREAYIQSETENLIFSIGCFKRAGGRKERGAKIRNSIEITIDGKPFLFTKREWEAGRIAAWNVSCRQIPNLLRAETTEKIMISKRLSKARSARILIEADACYASQKEHYSS